MAQVGYNSVRQETHEPLRWGFLILSLLLVLVSALCLLKYMGWAWVVSGAYGLSSQAERVAVAQRWSLIYFWAGLLTEGALVASLTFNLRFDRTQLTGAPKTAVRLLVASGIAVVGTLCTAFLLSVAGRMLR